MRFKLEQIIKQMEVLNKTYDPVAPIAIGEACRALKEYKQLKADYENRLRADMVAMLTDLSMEIGEIEDGYAEFDEEEQKSLTMIPLESVDRLIKQKINALKEAADVKDDSKQ